SICLPPETVKQDVKALATDTIRGSKRSAMKELVARSIAVALGLLAGTSPCRAQAVEPRAAKRPNVLFLFSDDQRADTIAALGNNHIQTPSLDRLAGQGTAFTRAYCMGAQQGAVCVPSRAMLMTGRTLFRISEQL